MSNDNTHNCLNCKNDFIAWKYEDKCPLCEDGMLFNTVVLDCVFCNGTGEISRLEDEFCSLGCLGEYYDYNP